MGLRLFSYAASANCLKVRILLAHLGLAYEIQEVDIFRGGTLTEQFAAINPAKRTPVLELGDGTYLPESNAILWYLAETTNFLPSRPLDRAQVLRWLIFEQTQLDEAVATLRFRLFIGQMREGDAEVLRRRQLGQSALTTLESWLKPRSFLVAERYTIADIAIYGYIHVADEAGYRLDEFPAVSRWLATVEGQPGFVNDMQPIPTDVSFDRGQSIYG